MTDIYLHIICTYYGLYGNTPVGSFHCQLRSHAVRPRHANEHSIRLAEIESVNKRRGAAADSANASLSKKGAIDSESLQLLWALPLIIAQGHTDRSQQNRRKRKRTEEDEAEEQDKVHEIHVPH